MVGIGGFVAEGDEGDGAEVIFFGAEDGGGDNVLAVAQAAVGADGETVAVVVFAVGERDVAPFGQRELRISVAGD